LKNCLDDKGFIFNKNAKDFKAQKILIQNSIYRIQVRINFVGFYSKVLFEDAVDFFKQFGQVYQLILCEEGSGFIVFNTPLDSQNCWDSFNNQIQRYENSIISISIPDDIDLDGCKDLTSFQTDTKPSSNKIHVNRTQLF
jgi:RNA recognition motif-containing protein